MTSDRFNSVIAASVRGSAMLNCCFSDELQCIFNQRINTLINL